MPINFTDAIINIGQQSSQFDCNNFWTTLIAAFAGTLAAFIFNVWRESTKEKNKNITNLNALIQTLTIEFCDLIDLEEDIQKNIKTRYYNAINNARNGNPTTLVYSKIIKQSPDKQDFSNMKFVIKNTKSLYTRLLNLFSRLKNLDQIIDNHNNNLPINKEQNIYYIENVLISQLDEILKVKEEIIENLKFVIFNLNLYQKEYFNQDFELLFNEEKQKIIYEQIPYEVDVKAKKNLIQKFMLKFKNEQEL